MPIPSIDRKTAELQILDEILDWNSGIVEALIAQRVSVQDAIRTGHSALPKFVGMTEADIDAYYDTQRRELDRFTALNFVASAEATSKIDYFRRVGKKLKDQLAIAYQKWHNSLSGNKQLRPDFDEGGILDILKETGLMNNHIIGRFRECLRARHWVGHGRYWAKPAEVDRLDPEYVYDRAKELLNALPA